MARLKWGFKGLENPFEGTEIAVSDIRSTRRLRPGELELICKLVKPAQECINFISR